MELLQAKDWVKTVIRSLSQFSERTWLILSEQSDVCAETKKIGPSIIFERLWQEIDIKKAINRLLANRRFEFDIERAIFLNMLHRLMVSGSDRFCDKWRGDYLIEGTEDLSIH